MSRSYRRNVWLAAVFFGDHIKKKNLRTRKIDIKCGSDVDNLYDDIDDEIVSSNHGSYKKMEGQTYNCCTREIFFQIPRKHYYHGIPIRISDREKLTKEFEGDFYMIMQANC